MKNKIKRRKARKASTKKTIDDSTTEETMIQSAVDHESRSPLRSRKGAEDQQSGTEESESDDDSKSTSSSSSGQSTNETQDQIAPASTASASTPPPIEPFPIPTKAAEPDPTILAAQGLPAGLSSATVVHESLRNSIDEYNHGENQLSLTMLKNLKKLGIAELFAGMST